MIKELRARGPILFDFNAGAEFQAYRGGILSEDLPVSKTFKQSLAQLGHSIAQSTSKET